MRIDQMRERISQVYSGPLWRLKVSGMEDRQVFAIYKNMEREGKFDKAAGDTEHGARKKNGTTEAVCQQLNIWDILREQKGDENNAPEK